MKKKEIKFTANLQDESGVELIRQDMEKIQELNPGFMPPMLVKPLEPLVGAAPKRMEAKTVLSMPIKKDKKE